MMTKNKYKYSGVIFVLIILSLLMSFNVSAQTLPGGGFSTPDAFVPNPTPPSNPAPTPAPSEKKPDVINDNLKVTGEVGVIDGLYGDAYNEAVDGIKGVGEGLADAGNKLLDGDIKGAAGSYLESVVGGASTVVNTGLAALGTGWDVAKSIVTGENQTRIGNKKAVWTDPATGAQYEVEVSKDGQIMATNGAMKGCMPLPVKLAEQRSCLFCPLFKVLFDAANTMATKSFDALATGMRNVMAVGFALFIAFQVLTHVSSLTKQDAPKFLMGLMTQSFKVLIAYLLLKSSKEVYEYIIGPLLSAALDFGTNLLFQTKTEGGADLAACASGANIQDAGLLPGYLYTKLDCFIKAVQQEIGYAQAIGSSLMCVGRNAAAGSVSGLWDFGMVINGFIIYVFALLISLAFAFYLIDATVQLGIVGALMPFLIACWPFKMTSSYTSKGWGIFMNSAFMYIFMGLVVSVNIQLMGQSLGSGSGGFDEIEAAINGNEVEKLQTLMDIGFGGFLILICCCLFGFKFTSQASALAGQMGHGGGGKIGAGIGGMAASGATNAAKKVSAPARKAIATKAGGAWNATKDGASNLAGKAGSAIKSKFSGSKSRSGGSGDGTGGSDDDSAPTTANTQIKAPTTKPISGGAGGVSGSSGAGGSDDAGGGDNVGGGSDGSGGAEDMSRVETARSSTPNPSREGRNSGATSEAHDIRAGATRTSTNGNVTSNTNGQVALSEDKDTDTMQVIGAGKKGTDAYKGSVKNASQIKGPIKANDIDQTNMQVDTNQLHGADKQSYNNIEKQVMAANGMKDKATLDPVAKGLLKQMSDAEFLAQKLNGAIGTFKSK